MDSYELVGSGFIMFNVFNFYVIMAFKTLIHYCFEFWFFLV